jgi:eukaryotic-like serine/threonine-protein kinase
LAFWDNWFGKKKTKEGPYAAKAKAGVKAAKSKPKPSEGQVAISAGRRKGKVNIEKRFKLLNRLGQGSMSKVWRATDNESGKTVVVKVLDQEKLVALRKRFIGMNRPSEGEVAVQLNHPNIVKCYEFGLTSKGEEYLAMEFVDGVGFNFLVETRAKQLVGREVYYLEQIGEAIGYFHRKGFIHRDICPRNVMVDKNDVVKLIDFGLAVPDTPEFRKPGNRTGTANYMAPELLRRQPTDIRIDVYSFGVTVFETFCGKLPMEMLTVSYDTMLKHLNAPARDPRELRPDLPDETVRVMLKGIARRPDDRYQNMNQFLSELRNLRGDKAETRPAAQPGVDHE